jgi:riboflavin kinase/FMN adenylyltransferase
MTGTALLHEELARAAPGSPTAITIGKFDGVHRGHQHLIRQLMALARGEGLASVVVTFHPQPAVVLRPGTQAPYLCSLEERVEFLRALGVDAVAIVSFTSELAQLSANDFVSSLVRELQMRLLLVGPDFTLGRQREGDRTRLQKLGQEMGYRLEVTSLLIQKGEKVGSRAAHDALAQGDMGKVAELLGRPFSLQGPIVRGAQRGKTLGFPTANVAIGLDLALPSFGVYVTRSHVCGQVYPSVSNIGVRPTFDAEAVPTVEAYLLDFEGDLYNQEMRLEVLHRLRPEERFPSVEALIEAMERDLEAAREYFRERG